MSKRMLKLINFSIILALVLGGFIQTRASATANTYYVSLTGSDTNPGSSTAPFKSFAKAVAVLAPGDTLQVMAGTYTTPLTLSTSGTSSAPINVIGTGAILNMQGVNANGISISGSYIRASQFEVLGATDFGIYITGKHVTVDNNYLHDNVTKNGVVTCGLLSTGWGSAIKVKVGAEDTIIRNNTVYDNCGEGIAVTRGITALVEGNSAYDNFSVNIYIDNSAYVTVQNNTAYCTGTHLRNGNRATGIALGEEMYSGWGAQLHDITIADNTIQDCRTGVAAYASNVSGTLTNVTITNNYVPSGQVRGVSVQTLSNQNVQVSYNTLFNAIYVEQPAGVTLVGNIIGGIAPTATSQPAPTATMTASPVPTRTPVPPTATSTAVPIMPSSTFTPTVVPLTSTVTAILATATATFTKTVQPAMPTATSTWTSAPSATLISPLPSATPGVSLPTATAVPPTMTPGVPAPSSAETIFDDKDNSFIYSTNWKNIKRQNAYDGSYKSTTQNGAYVTFNFTGQSFSVLYRGGVSARRLNVFVDNVQVGTIDESASAVTYQMRWDYPGQLAQGNHTLKLVFDTLNKSNDTNGTFDALIVR